MGKIKQVIYQEIKPEIYSEHDAGLHYFYINSFDINSDLQNEYNDYFMKQLELRNTLLSETKMYRPKVNSAMFGISSLKNNAILLCDLW